jgi:hypothetical protein
MNETNWSVHVEWVVLMATIIGGIYVIDGKIHTQVSEMRSEMHAQTDRSDRLHEAQTQRIDRLYEMFIDLVKERK